MEPLFESSVEQCVIEQYAMIDVRSRKQVVDYVDGLCEFRSGFGELLSECESDALSFTVVSAGLDFCIRHAFRKLGLSQPSLVCPRSSLVAGKGFKLSFPPRHFAASKDFKENIVRYRKMKGDRVIFIGDETGDFNVAVKADVLFAIKGSPLDTMCTREKIAHQSISTFAPVQRFIHISG